MSQTRVFITSLCAGALALTLLAGCGKRGPLYMPGERDPQQAAPTQAQEQPGPDASTPGD